MPSGQWSSISWIIAHHERNDQWRKVQRLSMNKYLPRIRLKYKLSGEMPNNRIYSIWTLLVTLATPKTRLATAAITTIKVGYLSSESSRMHAYHGPAIHLALSHLQSLTVFQNKLNFRYLLIRTYYAIVYYILSSILIMLYLMSYMYAYIHAYRIPVSATPAIVVVYAIYGVGGA